MPDSTPTRLDKAQIRARLDRYLADERQLGRLLAAREALHRGLYEAADEQLAAAIEELRKTTGLGAP